MNHGRPFLDAHNCYPYDGQWKNRIDRALASGRPVSIEQDIAWYEGRAVVTHTAQTTGAEPDIRSYFFERVRPIVETALAENNRAAWPLIILHFDFKDTRAPLLRAVWDILGEYGGWITTAVKTADPHQLQPFDVKPILVLTEDSDAQEEVFFNQVPVGAKLRVFGSAHTNLKRGDEPSAIPAAQLLTERPTNYRRWWNNSWNEVEQGGQQRAGEWTAADDARLLELVDRAHTLGYWIRFYTLDGFADKENRGWSAGYNFGSLEAVRIRWQAAIAAGVDMIATDQYEQLGELLR